MNISTQIKELAEANERALTDREFYFNPFFYVTDEATREIISELSKKEDGNLYMSYFSIENDDYEIVKRGSVFGKTHEETENFFNQQIEFTKSCDIHQYNPCVINRYEIEDEEGYITFEIYVSSFQAFKPEFMQMLIMIFCD